MKYSTLSFIVLSLVCLTNCTRAIVAVNYPYTSAELKDATIVVIPIKSQDVALPNSKHLFESVPALPYDEGKNFVASNLNTELLREFRYHFSSSPNNINVRRGSAVLDTVITKAFNNRTGLITQEASTVNFNIPIIYTQEEIEKVDFLVMVNQISFSSEIKEIEGYSGGFHGGGFAAGSYYTYTDRELHLTFHYLIWDYRKDKPASFGIAQSYTEVLETFTHHDWMALFQELPEHITGNLTIQ